jgi:putative nucleotidyltransferase with HDIG domain
MGRRDDPCGVEVDCPPTPHPSIGRIRPIEWCYKATDPPPRVRVPGTEQAAGPGPMVETAVSPLYPAAVAPPLQSLDRREAVEALHSLIVRLEEDSVSLAGHSERVSALAGELAIAAGWCRADADRLREAALMHDIGKIARSLKVLGKQDRLTAEEYEHVKTHALLGARMVAGLLDEEQTRWVGEHHERWDGTGYPFGRRGVEISEGGRLLAVADSFDAMTSARLYQRAMTVGEALAEVRAKAGTQFDPDAAYLLIAVVSRTTSVSAVLEPRS